MENIEGVNFLNFQIENINQLDQVLIDNPLLQGFSVTIPHKEKIINLLDEVDNHARQIGAVNAVRCFKTIKGNYLKGYNTDYYGFLNALKPFLNGNEKTALVLGNGGAAKAVLYTLNHINIKTIVVSRKNIDKSSTIQYHQIDEQLLSETDIIVNTTPLGMWPNIDNCPPIPYSYIKKNTIACDLVYNPEKTKFRECAEENGAIVTNGMVMLELQAEKAWEIFNMETENKI